MRSGHHYSTFQDIWKKKLQNKQNKISKHSHKNEGKQQRHTGNDNKDKVLLGDTQHELKKIGDGHRRSYRTAALTHDGNANYTEREPVVTATVKCEMGVAPQRLWSPLVHRHILGGDQMQPGWVQHIGHRDLPGPSPLLTPPLSLAFAIGTGCMWFPWGGGAWVRGFYWCVRQKLLQKKTTKKKDGRAMADAAAEAEARWQRRRQGRWRAAAPATLQSSASEFPQDESCALLPSRSFGGSVKSNCSQGGGGGGRGGGGVGRERQWSPHTPVRVCAPQEAFSSRDANAANVDGLGFARNTLQYLQYCKYIRRGNIRLVCWRHSSSYYLLPH